MRKKRCATCHKVMFPSDLEKCPLYLQNWDCEDEETKDSVVRKNCTYWKRKRRNPENFLKTLAENIKLSNSELDDPIACLRVLSQKRIRRK